MKSIRILSMLLLSFTGLHVSAQGPAFLSEYQWNQRVLLLFHGEQDRSGLFPQQMAALLTHQAELAERDVIFFQLMKEEGTGPGIGFNVPRIFSEQIELLRQYYSVSPQEFTIILVGKDGSEKLRKRNQILSTQELFSIIDGMPMRQQELRERQ
jgi:hypothetical protein